MITMRQTSCLAALYLAACGSTAFAGDYRDSSGFSFTYPDGWFPVTRGAAGDINQAAPRELKNWLANNKVDLNRIAVMLIRNGNEEFLENLNVVVENEQIPLNNDSVKKLADLWAKQSQSMGAKLENYQGRVQRVGSRDAIVTEHRIQMPGVPVPLWQRQVLFPGGGKTFIVTCTAKADSFQPFVPTFDTILASFQVPPPVAMGFNWKQVGVAAIVGGIVGGLGGGLAVFIKKTTSKPRRKRDDDDFA